MGTYIGQGVYHAISTLFAGFGCFVYHFQTLIAGGLAIAAAYYGAAPVWRQLKDSNLQTSILRRDNLAVRLGEAEIQKSRVEKDIDHVLWAIQDVSTDYEGNAVEVGEHDAHGLEQMVDGCADWYLVSLRGTEEASIESAKLALSNALAELEDTLNNIHWPAHNDQYDEDHSIIDETWEEILETAKSSKLLVANKVSVAWAANRRLKDTQQRWINELRGRIAILDMAIARHH